ncbi:carbohydrate ABC transporter permease [Bordetella genomosp. 11]|uniref:Sugar ABC transporter permease n=1 Tax=Bordetella genomosp. 11 TaxID=1416808 RepID=A0A261UXZ3_9BORD|nr:sugar ABC transporter permease [Bordetella genomosp. 11]OZI66749.1 sugar ABC transporter permease [Bordetella genomosp. 11]
MKEFWGRNQAWITPLLLLALPAGLFLLVIVSSIVQSIWLSLFDWDGTGPKTWVGLGNYVELFSDPQFWVSLKNNVIWLVLFLLAPVFGLALALFLNQKLPEMRFVKSMFFIPLVLAHVIIGVVFTWFYDPTFGLLALAFKALGLQPLAILSDEHFVTLGIIIAALWSQIAFCLVLFLAGLSQIDHELIAAAKMDGASGWRLFRHIVLPQLHSVTFVAVIITVIMSLRNFDMIAVMTQGGPYGSSTVLAYQMYDTTIFSFRAGYGAAIATVLFLIMSIYIALFLRYTLRNEAREQL